MSIAWGSLVLLVLLLPGVLFFVGVYFPEKFTREAEQRSPLGHLAAVLTIATGVHGIAYVVLVGLCHRWTWIPCIDVEALLRLIGADRADLASSRRMLETHRVAILVYLGLTSAPGLAAGGFYGRRVVSGRWKRFTRHEWVYELSPDGWTYAYVMTHIRDDNRVLMYQGFLRAFGLQQDGRFSYLVLRNVKRYYMVLGASGPTTSHPATHRILGSARRTR